MASGTYCLLPVVKARPVTVFSGIEKSGWTFQRQVVCTRKPSASGTKISACVNGSMSDSSLGALRNSSSMLAAWLSSMAASCSSRARRSDVRARRSERRQSEKIW